VFDFLHVTNDALTERGITLPLAGLSRTTPATRFEFGREVQAKIVGSEVAEAPREPGFRIGRAD
jgi:4-carboxymuconolactone decarboxylase